MKQVIGLLILLAITILVGRQFIAETAIEDGQTEQQPTDRTPQSNGEFITDRQPELTPASPSAVIDESLFAETETVMGLEVRQDRD